MTLLITRDAGSLYVRVSRETEYKGLQLSLDQATSKTTFPYSSGTGGSSGSLADSCRTPKSRAPRPKTKARLSPYTRVRILTIFLSYRFMKTFVRFSESEFQLSKEHVKLNDSDVQDAFSRAKAEEEDRL